MSKFKFTVIGAGSTYTPELINGFAQWGDKLPVDEIALCDIDEERLMIMHGFCQRYAENLGLDVKITATTDRREAIKGATFVNTQIRVGGNEARVLDEKIPLSYGLIGQETTGAGGFAKALRTIPVMLDIARDVAEIAPDAWILNYTNPTGLVSEAINNYTNAKIAGFCSGGIFPKMWAKEALDIDYDRVRYDYIGLNHMNFVSNIMIDGIPATEDEFLAIAAKNDGTDLEVAKLLGCIPSPYLQYYYHTAERVEKLKKSPQTRGEAVMDLEKEIYEAYGDPNVKTKPEALLKRGGGGYTEVAMGFLNAVYNDEDTWMIVNTPNQRALPFLPNKAVIETACLVNKSGIKPLTVTHIPPTVYGLIAAVKNYESLAVKAAVEGDKRLARQALLAHPLVREFSIIDPLLEDLLQGHKKYLPQFFGTDK